MNNVLGSKSWMTRLWEKEKEGLGLELINISWFEMERSIVLGKRMHCSPPLPRKYKFQKWKLIITLHGIQTCIQASQQLTL